MLCSSGAPNLSLWAFLATALPSPDNKHAFGAAARAASARQPPAPLKKKVYVTFQTNEGAKNAFSSHIYSFMFLNDPFFQDRLGTNTRKR